MCFSKEKYYGGNPTNNRTYLEKDFPDIRQSSLLGGHFIDTCPLCSRSIDYIDDCDDFQIECPNPWDGFNSMGLRSYYQSFIPQCCLFSGYVLCYKIYTCPNCKSIFSINFTIRTGSYDFLLSLLEKDYNFLIDISNYLISKYIYIISDKYYIERKREYILNELLKENK